MIVIGKIFQKANPSCLEQVFCKDLKNLHLHARLQPWEGNALLVIMTSKIFILRKVVIWWIQTSHNAVYALKMEVFTTYHARYIFCFSIFVSSVYCHHIRFKVKQKDLSGCRPDLLVTSELKSLHFDSTLAFPFLPSHFVWFFLCACACVSLSPFLLGGEKVVGVWRLNNLLILGSFHTCSGEDLIAPCHCKGTQKYVHRSCLDNWRSTKVNY